MHHNIVYTGVQVYKAICLSALYEILENAKVIYQLATVWTCTAEI